MPISTLPKFSKWDGAAIIGALLLCLFLFLDRYPHPYCDDIAFIGAAMNLAKGGSFTNPYIAGFTSNFPSHYFFFQPPLHSYVLGAWLELFGISTISLLSFQWLFYLASGFALTLLLWRWFVVPIWVGVLGGTMLILGLLHFGLRYEPLAFAFFLSGVAVFRVDSGWRAAAGFLLIGAACLTLPSSPAYAAPLLGARLFLDGRVAAFTRRDIARLSLILGGCVALIVLLFAVLIHFRFTEFLATFGKHTAMRRIPFGKLPGELLRQLTFGFEWLQTLPTYLLWAVSVVLVWRNRRQLPLPWVVLTAALTASLVLNCLIYVSSVLRYALGFGCVVNLLALVLTRPTTRQQVAAGIFVGVVLLGSQLQVVGEFILSDRHSEANHAQVRATLAGVAPGKIFVADTDAARFIFDYRLPAGSQSWEWLFPAHFPESFQDRQPDSIWIMQTDGIQLPVKHDPVSILGHRSRTLVHKPFDISVVQ